MKRRKLKLFADYFQFYLQDESVEGNLADSWTDEAVKRRLALRDGTIGVRTIRNTTVPVVVDVLGSAPDDDLSSWDHVTECSIEVPSGRLVVAGCTDYFPDAARIVLGARWYRARVFHGDLDILSENGLDGKDHYKVALWPAKQGDVRILKQWKGPKKR